MPHIALELNDAGFVAAADAGGDWPASPGYALVEDDERIVTGAAARARARLLPRRTSNTFWSELDTEALPAPFPAGLSRADLAHTHLATVWLEIAKELGAEPVGAILALPGSYDGPRLGLVLGIARAAGLPVTGLVDAAVAATAAEPPAERFLYLDLELHRAVLSELAVEGSEVVRRRVEVSSSAGVAAFEDRLAKHIAATFVRHTRFDPLHAAATEQALHDRLPAIAAELTERGTASVTIESGGEPVTVEIDGERTSAAAADEHDHLTELIRVRTQGSARTLVISPRVSAIPGLGERLATVAETIIAVPASAAASGALAARAEIESPAASLPFVTRLALRSAAALAPSEAPSAHRARAGRRGPAPTHLLYEGRAYAISAEPFILGTAIPAGHRGVNVAGLTAGISRAHCRLFTHEGEVIVEDTSSYGTLLNGEQIAGRAAAAMGDRLQLGSPGVELLLITVADG